MYHPFKGFFCLLGNFDDIAMMVKNISARIWECNVGRSTSRSYGKFRIISRAVWRVVTVLCLSLQQCVFVQF